MTREVKKKTPGTILEEAREALGLSLGDVAAMTRIPRTMITHLEGDRFDEYSADVFVRGHLRSYARELKLDPQTVIEAWERHTGKRSKLGASAKEPVAGDQPISKARQTARKQVVGWQSHFSSLKRSVRATHVVAVALVLVFLFVVVNFLTGSRATAKDPAQFPTTNQQEWEVEKAAKETRWALEQPAEPAADDSESKSAQ